MIQLTAQHLKGTYGLVHYTVDTEDEIDQLPVGHVMGSTAFCIESGLWYILNGNSEWVEKKDTSSSGGGSSDDEIIYDGGEEGSSSETDDDYEIIYDGGEEV